MKNFKRLLSGLIVFISIAMLNPIGANAEWKSDSNGWWNTEGSSYSTGWRLIDGNWYYFYSDGYMAHDTKIGGYYLNSAGAWTTSIPTAVTSYTGGNNSGSTASATSNNQSQTVYVSRQWIYHTSPHAHGMKYYSTMSRSEAESEGNRACKICY